MTLRHLLTHTAGIGYWPRPTDVLRPGLGSGVQARRPTGSLAEYLRHGLRIEVEPGTKWMYSNHGFATLGQVVEDVTGVPFDRYLRDHVFEPLGMSHTDLVLSGRVRPRLATSYVLGRRGPEAVPWRDVPTPGGGAICATPRDMARYVAALLGGVSAGVGGTGGGGGGGILRPDTLATMYRPHFRADPRTAGMGLAFDLDTDSGHRIASKDGVVAGFLSQLLIAPDDGVGVVVLSNTGGLDARGAATPIGLAVMRHLLGLPDAPVRTDLPPHPEVWSELCGRYDLAPGPMTNLFLRLVMGAGAEVRVRRALLLLLGMGLGLALFHSRFGFTSAWRQLVAVGQGKALRAHSLLLAATAILFAPFLAAGVAPSGAAVAGNLAPIGVSLLVGATLFGVGMQIGGACASGTL